MKNRNPTNSSIRPGLPINLFMFSNALENLDVGQVIADSGIKNGLNMVLGIATGIFALLFALMVSSCVIACGTKTRKVRTA